MYLNLNKSGPIILLTIKISKKRSTIIWQLYNVSKYELFQNKTVNNWDCNINADDFPFLAYIMRQQHHLNSTTTLVNEKKG